MIGPYGEMDFIIMQGIYLNSMEVYMRKRIFRIISLLMVLAVLSQSAFVEAAKPKAKLNTKKISIQRGKSRKIQIRNRKKGAVYTYKSSNRKTIKVSKKGVIKALKYGTAKIQVKEKLNKKTRKVGTVTVKCVKQEKAMPVSTSTEAPVSVSGTPSTTPNMTPSPSQTETPVPTATPDPPIELQPITYEIPEDFDQSREGVTYGTVENQRYYSYTTEKWRKVNVILPTDYKTEKKYPVLYLLHGIGGDENEWLNGGNPVYIIGNLMAEGLAKEMIVVIPNCRARANDAATNEFSLDHYAAFDNFINDLRDNLMPFIQENYSIATGRKNTAIAGLSMGGRESLNIGLHMPDTFGYIAAFSPGYGVFAYSANGVSEEGLFTEETFRLPEEYKDNTLLMINNGISEGGENAIGGTCHKALDKNEIPHLFYVTEGGHDFTVWKHGLYNFALQIFEESK